MPAVQNAEALLVGGGDPLSLGNWMRGSGTWHLSTDSEPDFVVAPLEIRSTFPQELPLLLTLGVFRLVERFGDWSGRPFAMDAQLQLRICECA